MRRRLTTTVARHPRIVLVSMLLVLMLAFGIAGEVAAHNPGGQPVPGCENGAGTVPEKNPNCHG